MSRLQDIVIRNYKQTYPQDKLKDIASKTSIQITRVFRLLNGSEMKLKEYEAFEKAIAPDKTQVQLINQFKYCLNELDPSSIDFLSGQLMHLVQINKFKQEPVSSQYVGMSLN